MRVAMVRVSTQCLASILPLVIIGTAVSVPCRYFHSVQYRCYGPLLLVERWIVEGFSFHREPLTCPFVEQKIQKNVLKIADIYQISESGLCTVIVD
eukprot:sb/3479189/